MMFLKVVPVQNFVDYYAREQAWMLLLCLNELVPLYLGMAVDMSFGRGSGPPYLQDVNPPPPPGNTPTSRAAPLLVQKGGNRG